MKNKIKIFIAFGITLITTLIFTISTFAQVGYNINSNGNIESLNIFDGELVNGYHSGSNGNLTLTTGTLVTNKNIISLKNNTNYTISFTANNIYLDGICYYYSNGNFKSYEQLTNQNSPFTFLLSNEEYYISFNFISNSTINYTQITNVMLNEGQTALDYFPYGNYTNNKNIGNNGQLYEQLNGTTAKLYQNNITNIETAINTQGIIEETINIDNKLSYTWNSNSIPTIKNCIINYNPAINLGNRATVLLQLKNATIFNDLTFSRIDKNEDRYIYLYNEDKKLITTLTIARKVETITQKI